MQGDCGFLKFLFWLGCDSSRFSSKTKGEAIPKEKCVCKLCEFCSTRLFNVEGTSQNLTSSCSVSRFVKFKIY